MSTSITQLSMPLSIQHPLVMNDDDYTKNTTAFNLAIRQTNQYYPQIEFPIQLDIPRVNWGILRRLSIPFMGDEYYDLRICVNMWLWHNEDQVNLVHQTDQDLAGLITCPIHEIRLCRNGTQIYSCHEFRIRDDGLGGPGVVLGAGKLIKALFEPVMPIPLINRLHDRYDDYVLDVEFKGQQFVEFSKTELTEKKEKPKITLRTSNLQLLTRVYSLDIRRDKFMS
jgi:hypothetical protein